MKKFFFGLLFLLSTANTQAQSVQIYRSGAAVGAAYSSLAAAIAAAANGDSLKMSAHTFYEHDVLVNKNLVIAGDALSNAIIDAKSLGRVMLVKSPSVTLRNISIINGDGAKSAYIGYVGGGIYMDTFGVLTLCGNTIVENNRTTGSGGGISVSSKPGADSSIIILKNKVRIANNTGGDGGGIGMPFKRTKLMITDDVKIYNNISSAFGGGIDADLLYIYGSGLEGGVRIENNKAAVGGGFCANNLLLYANLTVNGNAADTLEGGGGGGFSSVFYFEGNGKMEVFNNRAKNGGGASNLLNFFNKNATILIYNNSAQYGGGLGYHGAGRYSGVLRGGVSGLNIYNNTADSTGGGINVGSTDLKGAGTVHEITLTNCDIHHNKANKHNGLHLYRLNSSYIIFALKNCRLFNPLTSGNQEPEITMPGYFLGDVLNLDSCWLGKSDTTGLIDRGVNVTFTMPRWVVCDWVLNNSMPLATWAPGFPLAARFRLNTSSALPPNSFSMLQGRFSGTLGSFTPAIANMKPINEIESRFTVSSAGAATIMGIVDADTFRQNLTVTDIKEKGFEQVRIYPNPATEIIYIEGLSIGSKIELYDMMGRLIFKNEEVKLNKSTIDLRALPSGNYLLKIINKNGEVGTTKLMKE